MYSLVFEAGRLSLGAPHGFSNRDFRLLDFLDIVDIDSVWGMGLQSENLPREMGLFNRPSPLDDEKLGRRYFFNFFCRRFN